MAIDIGADLVLDDAPAVAAPATGTDPLFLLHSTVTARGSFNRADDVRATYPAATALQAMADAFFREGGRRLHLVPLTGTGPAYDLATNLATINTDEGPGQVVAPEVTTTGPAAVLAAWAFTTKRFYIGQSTDGASDATLSALGAAIRAAAGDGRFSCVQGDTILIPTTSGVGTREVPGSVVLAAILARIDVEAGNQNLAAAGLRSQLRYGVAVKAPRGEAARNTVAESGVNSFRQTASWVRHYSSRTCADLTKWPHWWDIGGTRTVMAYMAQVRPIVEDNMFPQLDGDYVSLATLEAALSAPAAALQAVGALFKSGTNPGYRVVCRAENNPVGDLAQGLVRAQVRLRTSPHGEHIITSLTRLPITMEV